MDHRHGSVPPRKPQPQEARAIAALNHPDILAVYDIGTESGAPFLVTELLEGETLAERLRGGALPVRKALDIAIQTEDRSCGHAGLNDGDANSEGLHLSGKTLAQRFKGIF